MIQWFFISGYVLQNILQVGFGKTFQNLSYFDQSVAYVDAYLGGAETFRRTLAGNVHLSVLYSGKKNCATISSIIRPLFVKAAFHIPGSLLHRNVLLKIYSRMLRRAYRAARNVAE